MGDFSSIQNLPLVIYSIQAIVFGIGSFVLAMAVTPLFTDFLYKNKFGKNIREDSWDHQGSPIFNALHKDKKGTPTMAGILFWGITVVITVLFNFNRGETFLPLFFLISAGLLGALDDFVNIRGIGKIKGLGIKLKLFLQLLIAGFGAYWFTFKLNWTSFHIPGGNIFNLPYNIELGLWYIPIFILITIFVMNAVNFTDGLDGLLGGSIIPPFMTLAMLAFVQGHYALAIFISTLIGALTAFLWFNIYPARFFMGDTGSFALGATLAVMAMLTNSLVILPIIGFIFFVEGFSSLAQTFSKRFFGRKIFLSAPIHHHFQAKGWPESKITARFWIISFITSMLGLVIGLVGQG